MNRPPSVECSKTEQLVLQCLGPCLRRRIDRQARSCCPATGSRMYSWWYCPCCLGGQSLKGCHTSIRAGSGQRSVSNWVLVSVWDVSTAHSESTIFTGVRSRNQLSLFVQYEHMNTFTFARNEMRDQSTRAVVSLLHGYRAVLPCAWPCAWPNYVGVAYSLSRTRCTMPTAVV